MNKNPKSKYREAEVAAEHYAYEVLGCVRTVRAVRTKYQRQDMFASDVLGRRADGTLCAIQVTAGLDPAVSARKRKLEKEIWHEADTVLLLQLYWEQNPTKKRGKLWYFKIWEYVFYDYTFRGWVHISDHAVPQSWFKLYQQD